MGLNARHCMGCGAHCRIAIRLLASLPPHRNPRWVDATFRRERGARALEARLARGTARDDGSQRQGGSSLGSMGVGMA